MKKTQPIQLFSLNHISTRSSHKQPSKQREDYRQSYDCQAVDIRDKLITIYWAFIVPIILFSLFRANVSHSSKAMELHTHSLPHPG